VSAERMIRAGSVKSTDFDSFSFHLIQSIEVLILSEMLNSSSSMKSITLMI